MHHRRYTQEEKTTALNIVAETDGDERIASQQTGIPLKTIQRWVKKQKKHRRQHQWDKMERAYDTLADTTVKLSQAINQQIDSAPLNQLATTLNAVVNQFLKLDEQIAKRREEEAAAEAEATSEEGKEQIHRVEYVYPDGTIHDRPHWARNNPEYTSPLQGGGLRKAVWQNGNRQTCDHRPRGPGRTLLVAGTDLPDGQSGVARPEDAHATVPDIDQRNGATDRPG